MYSRFVIHDSRFPRIARLRCKARIVDRHAYGQVIQALPRVSLQAEHLVHRVVVVAADTGGADAIRLRRQIEHLADETTLPEQPAIERRAMLAQRILEARDHPEAEEAIPGDVL